MTKYKNIEEKLDKALELSKESQKGYGFNICRSGAEITATNVQEVDKDFTSNENKCQGTKLGSLHIHPESKDVIPFPQDITNVKPEVQKV